MIKRFFGGGWRVRLRSSIRCLRGPHFILVSWVRDADGELDFTVWHKGVDAEEAVYRLRVDGAEILQNKLDEDDALDEVNAIVKSKK